MGTVETPSLAATPPATPPGSAASHLPPGPKHFTLRSWVDWVRRPVAFMDEQARRYGTSFSLPGLFGLPAMLWISEPDEIRDAFLSDPGALHAGEANYIVEAIVGSRSLLILDGEPHKRERKLMMPPFHGERMRAYGTVMQTVTGEAIARWPHGQPVSLLPEMQAVTLDIILRTVFGIDEDARLAQLRLLLREMLRYVSSPLLFMASIAIRPMKLRRLILRAMQPLRLGPLRLHLAPLVPFNKAQRLIGDVDAFLYAELARRRACVARGEPSGEDVLSMLLAARDESGQPMSDIELRDEMVTLLLAGHETTAITLAWAFHHLVENPAVLVTLLAELAPLLAEGPLVPDAVAALPYLDAVIKETMRLSPVVPIVARMVKREQRIGRWTVPAGMVVIPNIYLTHHRADLWPEPEMFRPERFIERKPGPYEFFPFGGGVRRCVGAAFATYEMKIVLAEVVSRVAFSRAGATVKVERRGILLAPSGGTTVVVRPRN